MVLFVVTQLLTPIASDPAPAAGRDVIWPIAHRIDKPDAATVDAAPAPTPEPDADAKRAAANAALDRLQESERSWSAQLLRTLLSLGVVVALIYLVFKVVAPRLLGIGMAVKGGKSLKVLERVQLDGRHAVVLLEIDGRRRYLCATGERGVQLLADVSAGAKTAPPRTAFDAVLQRAGTGAAGATPADEELDEEG
ncbi:MAG: flagellar biosynthetic protein FliO [Deltaproteobacteria bacterium]|nr:flagellar biosynthetic protein FliO [Deltaproteobacteria bacterium]